MLEIVERTKAIVVQHLVVDPDDVIESASFLDDLGADSLDMAELAIKFEHEFGVEISDDTAESILTVGDAVKFIKKHSIT
jgi:acyl carrier protein